MQKRQGNAESAGGEGGKDAPPGGKGEPKGSPKRVANGGIVPLEFVAAMAGGACTKLAP